MKFIPQTHREFTLFALCSFALACTEVQPGNNLRPKDDDNEGSAGNKSTDNGSGGTGSGGQTTNLGGETGGQTTGMGGNTTDEEGQFPALEYCAYSSELTAMGGAPGDPQLLLRKNAFVGQVLTDASDFTLYTYGADRPGTCDFEPLSGCKDDCAIAWPPFAAPSGSLGEGLDPSDFGEFKREDGSRQTTYRGWPLYYYKKDLVAGDLNGQGKGSIWHAASTNKLEVTILRDAENNKFLVNGQGFTLYSLTDDVVGNEMSDPVSQCTGSCQKEFVPYRGNRLIVETSLNANEFQSFTSPKVGRQVAYQGRPLYLYVGDEKPTDTSGLGVRGAELIIL